MTVLPLYALQDRHEPLHGFRIIVGEEQALAAIEGFDRRHILCRQCEVKEVKVLLYPVLVRGLGDHDNITLEQEAQGGLCGGFAVLLADLGQNGVGEHILAAFRKRAPGFDLAAVFLRSG